MSTVINTNSAANLAAYNLGRTNDNLQRSLNRLSSGSRINSSYDDAGGLAVSMKMSAAIRRAESYAANIQNARSFLQTQDGALAHLGKLLERMSELKSLAHDVTKNGGDVDLYEKEYIQLQTQFAQTTAEQFNGINLFSPTATPDPLFLSHPERGDKIQISRPALADLNTGDTLNLGEDNYSVVSGTFTWTQAKADAESKGGHLVTITSAEEWDRVLKKAPVADSRNLWIGAYQQDLSNEPAGNWQWVTGEPWGYSNWYQGEPNNLGGENCGHKIAGTDKWNDFSDNNPSVQGYIFEKPIVHLLDLPWSDLHASIMQVAQARAQNGAEQMRLEMAADLNSTNILNIESAVSRIMDVDIAVESATLARSRVLQQAGTAMLAQANQSSQSILKLIQMN
jgi:flagellin-like hook-associated protein FlgL